MQHDEHIYDCQRHPLIPCDSTWMSEAQKQYAESWKALAKKLIGQIQEEQKETHAMSTLKAEYNGFTGELVKLERKEGAITEDVGEVHTINAIYRLQKATIRYDLSIYDAEKKATISFDGVKLKDIKFLGGAVSFE